MAFASPQSHLFRHIRASLGARLFRQNHFSGHSKFIGTEFVKIDT